MTLTQDVYDRFFDLIVDDFYEDLTEEEIKRDNRSLLMSSVPLFEFPSHPFSFITQTVLGEDIEYFEQDLTLEETNILAYGMVIIWCQRQVTSIEAMRQKFSGSDFKVSSQASHLARLSRVLEETKLEHRRLQMLHSRRRVNPQGKYESTFGMFVEPMYPKVINRRGVSAAPSQQQQP